MKGEIASARLRRSKSVLKLSVRAAPSLCAMSAYVPVLAFRKLLLTLQYEASSPSIRAMFESFGEIKTFFDLIQNRGMAFVTFVCCYIEGVADPTV